MKPDFPVEANSMSSELGKAVPETAQKKGASYADTPAMKLKKLRFTGLTEY